MKRKILIIITTLLLCSCKNKTQYLDIDSSLVQNLYLIATPSNDANVLKNRYYSTEIFNNDYILAVGLKNYLANQIDEVKTISKKDIEESIFAIFGENISFKHNKIYLYWNNYCGFDYQDKLEQYELISACDGNMFENFYYKIVEAKEMNKEIIITEKSIYTIFDDEFKTISIYNSINDKKLIDKIEYSNSINIEDYLDEASTYEYSFKKVDDKYILNSITEVKD